MDCDVQLVLVLLLFHFCFVCVVFSSDTLLKGTSVTNVEDIFFVFSYQPESKCLVRDHLWCLHFWIYSPGISASNVQFEMKYWKLLLVWRAGHFLYLGSTKALSSWAKSIFFDICTEVQGSRGETEAAHVQRMSFEGSWEASVRPLALCGNPTVAEEWEGGRSLQAFYLVDTTGDPDE